MEGKTLINKIVAAIVVGSFLTVTTACYGPFNLTKNVYQWNSNIKGSSEVNEKWMKEFVFFGMIIIPVYMFSALLDAFIFNSIQFWSGSNPVKVTQGPDGFPQEVKSGESTIQFSWSSERRSATLAYRRNGDLIKTVRVMAHGDVYRVVDEDIGAAYVLERHLHEVTIIDGDCRLVQHVPMERL